MLLPVPEVLFVCTVLLEIIVFLLLVLKLYTAARFVSLMTVASLLFYASAILWLYVGFVSVLLSLIGLFRAFNVARVAVAKLHPKELLARYRRTTLALLLYSLPLVYLLHYEISINYDISFSYLVLLLAVVLFVTTCYSFIRWRSISMPSGVIKNIPTVSVCIPARNETQDLPGCIESVLASTYPKLEILVLDDCSHDKTPGIIKEYAHQGVRFIKGQEPSTNWIAKNSAMHKLFNESTGEIVIFAGVDIRFSPQTVQYLIEQLEHGLLDMISVLPKRTDDQEGTVFIQPHRYWWELAVPRLFGKRPPALSSLWVIKRKKLIATGGFESVKRSVRPEAHFAKRLSGAYRFVLSSNKLGVSSVKGMREQFDTALRMRYPQARRRPESVLALLVLELVIFVGPVVGLLYGSRSDNSIVYTLSISSILLLVLINIAISRLTVKRSWLIGSVSLPFLLILEWYVLIRSMIAYEFGVVKWKERNICLPMLQVDKTLPKM